MAFSGFIFSHALIKLSSLSMNTYIYNIYTDHHKLTHFKCEQTYFILQNSEERRSCHEMPDAFSFFLSYPIQQ